MSFRTLLVKMTFIYSATIKPSCFLREKIDKQAPRRKSFAHKREKPLPSFLDEVKGIWIRRQPYYLANKFHDSSFNFYRIDYMEAWNKLYRINEKREAIEWNTVLQAP